MAFKNRLGPEIPENDDDDEVGIVVMPVTIDGQPTVPVAGANMIPCSKCGQSCWLAPSSQSMINQKFVGKKIQYFCLPDCALGIMQTHQKMPVTEDQVEEIKQNLKRMMLENN